jgi:hypothetical protein
MKNQFGSSLRAFACGNFDPRSRLDGQLLDEEAYQELMALVSSTAKVEPWQTELTTKLSGSEVLLRYDARELGLTE